MTTNFAPIDFSAFDDDVEVSDRLPIAQLVNPPKLSDDSLSSYIKKGDVPWGFFITTSAANDAGFTPDGVLWNPCKHEFSTKAEEGFLSPSPRMLVLKQSQMEVYENVVSMKDGREYTNRTFRGVAYIGSSPTQWMDKVTGRNNGGVKEKLSNDQPRFVALTRYLLLFLDENNNPLHRKPFVFTGKGASATNFSIEYRKHTYDIQDAFFAARGEGASNKRLSQNALAFTVFHVKFGFGRNNPQHSPFTYPIARFYVGDTEKKVGRDYSRSITLLPTTLESLIIPKQSPLGKTIIELLKEYSTFNDLPAVADADLGATMVNSVMAAPMAHPAIANAAPMMQSYQPPAPPSFQPPVVPPPVIPEATRYDIFCERATLGWVNREGWKDVQPPGWQVAFGQCYPTLEAAYENLSNQAGGLEFFEQAVRSSLTAPAFPPKVGSLIDDEDVPF
jgi:hypothetical protein